APQGGVHFRAWARARKRVAVVLKGPGAEGEFPLGAEADGFFSAHVPDAQAGTLYRFRLDDDPTLYPDPASRFQPDGPHGPSQVIDGSAFPWTDRSWRGVPPENQVLYEMHIGTFTADGTWTAAERQLPQLADLSITCLELI